MQYVFIYTARIRLRQGQPVAPETPVIPRWSILFADDVMFSQKPRDSVQPSPVIHLNCVDGNSRQGCLQGRTYTVCRMNGEPTHPQCCRTSWQRVSYVSSSCCTSVMTQTGNHWLTGSQRMQRRTPHRTKHQARASKELMLS